MKRIFVLLILSCAALAQNTTTITAVKIQGVDTNLLSSGSLCFLGVDDNGNTLPFRSGAGGQVTSVEKCTAVASGAIGAFSVPNPDHTSPLNVKYRIRVLDVSGTQIRIDSPVSLNGTTWNYDDMTPSTGGAPLGNFSCPTGQVVNGISPTGQLVCGVPSGSGITSLNGLNAVTQTFANDTNVQISSLGTVHTLTWSGALAKARQHAMTAYLDGAQTFTATNNFSGFHTVGNQSLSNSAALNLAACAELCVGSSNQITALLSSQFVFAAQDNSAFDTFGAGYISHDDNHAAASGVRSYFAAAEVDANHHGTGDTTETIGVYGSVNNRAASGAPAMPEAWAFYAETSTSDFGVNGKFGGYYCPSHTFNFGAAKPTTFACFYADDQSAAGVSNFAWWSGLGRVHFGDNVDLAAGKSVTADSLVGALTGNASTATALAATPSLCTAGNYARGVLANGNATGCTAAGGGSGTVTSFSSGNLSPLFTTSVATSTTTPALSFTLSNFAAHTFYGNSSGISAAPTATLLAAADLPSTAVNSVVNDTNVTGSISAQVLTLGWTGTAAKARLLGTVVYTDQANTFTAGAKQAFAASATTAGAAFAGVTADPSTPASGDLWFRTDTEHLKFRDNATTTHSLMATDDSVLAAQMPALTGDITTSAGAVATTLATVNSNVGTFMKVTVNGKGLTTAATTAAVADLSDGTSVATNSGVQNQSYSYLADSGAADAYVITLSPAVGSYLAGQRFAFKATNANLTTTPTLNVNALGAKTITKNGGSALAASDIKTGQIVDVEYDGTNFQMQSTLGNASGGSGTTINATNGVLPKRSNATTFVDSMYSDDGTTATVTGAFARTSSEVATEIAAPSAPASGKQIIWADSTTKRLGSKDSLGFTVTSPDVFDDSSFTWKDDFGQSNSASGGESGTWGTQTFTSATFSRQTGTAPNIGLIRIATPATLSNGGAIQSLSGNVGWLPDMSTAVPWKMEWIFKITSASTADHQLFLGFGTVNNGGATASSPGSIFAGLRYKTTSTESDTAFHYVSETSAVYADTGTTSVVDNTAFHKFVMYSTVAGTIQFVMDGVSMGSTNTHIPTSGMAPIAFLSNGAGTAAKSIDIDKFAIEFANLAR